MGLPWIQVDKHLPGSPAVINLAADMGISVDEALGMLIRLWCWAADAAPDGRVDGARRGAIIETVAGRQPAVSHLLANGFLIEEPWRNQGSAGVYLRIAGWSRYQKALEKSARDASRKREARARSGAETARAGPPDVQRRGAGETETETETETIDPDLSGDGKTFKLQPTEKEAPEKKERDPSDSELNYLLMCKYRREVLVEAGEEDPEDEGGITPTLINTALKRVFTALKALPDSLVEEPLDVVHVYRRGYLAGDWGATTDPPYCFRGFISEKVYLGCYKRWDKYLETLPSQTA